MRMQQVRQLRLVQKQQLQALQTPLVRWRLCWAQKQQLAGQPADPLGRVLRLNPTPT